MSELEQALQLTRAMLATARAQEWDSLVALEAMRELLLLREHAADPVSQALLGEILAYDRELRELVGRARDAVGEQWQLEDGRARAIAAYAEP